MWNYTTSAFLQQFYLRTTIMESLHCNFQIIKISNNFTTFKVSWHRKGIYTMLQLISIDYKINDIKKD